MEQETFGDFTLESALDGLLGNNEISHGGGNSFPVMAPPTDDDDVIVSDDEKVEKSTNGFKDERASASDNNFNIVTKDPSELIDEEGVEDIDEEEIVEEEEVEPIPKAEDEVEDVIEEDADDKETGDIFDLGDAEPEISAFVQEKLYNKLGWDIEDGEGIASIEDLVDHMEKIVEANSAPKYASKDIEDLNSFVENGGNLKDYFEVQSNLDLNNMDLTVESNQRAVVKQVLKERGLTDTQAERKVQRYEDTGILEDEAIEGKEFLETIETKRADTLLKEQAQVKRQAEEQQQKFYKDVSLYIDKLDNVKGFKMSKVDREKVKSALFSVGPDGKTAYQKAYNEEPVKNLIDSVFFTIKKDAVVKDLQRQAESKATKNLKKRLETKTKRGKSTGAFEDKSSDNTVDHSSLSVFNSFIKP